jgi:Zn-dependent protease
MSDTVALSNRSAPAVLTARNGVLGALSDLFWRKPKLLLFLMLLPPVLWLGIVYLGSLFTLLLQSFFSIDEYSGMIKREFTLKTYGELLQPSDGNVPQRVAFANLLLAALNLMPAFPMDGGRILRAILQQFFMSRLKATWIAVRVGQLVALLMAVLVGYLYLNGYQGFNLILLLIAYTIYRAAEREYQSVLAESRQDGPFDGFNGPPGDEVRISPPPYRSGREWTDIKRL